MPRLAKSQKNKKNLEVHCRVQIYHSVKLMQSAPPRTAGRPVSSTEGVMGNGTQSPS